MSLRNVVEQRYKVALNGNTEVQVPQYAVQFIHPCASVKLSTRLSTVTHTFAKNVFEMKERKK